MRIPTIVRGLMASFLLVAPCLVATAQTGYTWANVRIGGTGNVTSIQAHPAVPNLFFATTDVGNCYRWNSTTGAWEGLMNWVPASQWNNTACENIAFDPSDSTGDTLFATVGKYGTQTYSWAPEGEVLKSTNRGTTWADAGLSIWVSSNGVDKGGGERLGVDPQNGSVVYVTVGPSPCGSGSTPATCAGGTYNSSGTWVGGGLVIGLDSAPGRGTYRGTNGGTSWTQINTMDGMFIAFDVSGGMVNGVTKNVFLGTDAGVYLSTDGGNTFTLSGSSSVNAGRASISKDGTMYVGTSTGVLKWNAGAWTTVSPVVGTSTSPVGYHALAVDPNNSSNVIASVGGWNSPTYVSNNGGSTWTQISGSYDIAAIPWFNPNLGWDAKSINDFAWDPFNTGAVWSSDIWNIWQTSNIWASPVAWTAQVVGEEEMVTDGTLLAPPPGSPNVLLSSAADVGGFDHTSLTTSPAVSMATWFPYTAALGFNGSMTGVAVQQTNPNFIARVGRVGWEGGGYAGYSTNGGASYTLFSNPLPGAGGIIAVSATSQTMLWATQSGQTYRSTDDGNTWTQIATLPYAIATGYNIFASNGNPLAADKVNGNKFYAYNNGRVYVSTDGGATFAVNAILTSTSTTVNQIEVETSPGIEGDLWISLQGTGLFHSTNSGATFTQIPNVQDAELMAVGMAASTTPAVYVMGTVDGFADGVFRSDNVGATWTEIDTPEYKMGNQPNAMAADLSTYGRVFIGTNGDGIFVGTYTGGGSGTTVPVAPTGLTATNTTSANQMDLSWTASTTPGVTYSVFRSTTAGFAPSGSTQIASGGVGTSYLDTGLLSSTTYYYVVEASDAAGTSPPSSQASATTSVGPFAPAALTASAVSANQINLDWTASATTGVTYSVFRSNTAGFTPSFSNQLVTGDASTTYSDTGLLPSTTYYYVVEANNSAGASLASSQASAITPAGTGGGSTIPVLSIDSGGPAVGSYVADMDFSGGLATSTTAYINTSHVTNAAPQQVYQTERYGASTYTIPGLTAGTQYTVTLQFAEIYWTAAGQREFNVIINGTQVLTNFDIIAAAGGANTAIAESYTATANSSGQIVVQLAYGAVDQPKISGISVAGAISTTAWYEVVNQNSGNCVDIASTSNSSAVDQSTCLSGQYDQQWQFVPTSNGYYSVINRLAPNKLWDVSGGPGATAPDDGIDLYSNLQQTNQQWMPVSLGNGYYKFVALNSGLCLDVPGAVTTSGVQLQQYTCDGTAAQAWKLTPISYGSGVQSIDVGGPAVGNYAADEYFSGGNVLVSDATINTTASTTGAPPQVYQSDRWAPSTYTIPGLTAGTQYAVTLQFAEVYWTTAGKRQFNVLINGAQVLTNFDIVAAAGGEYVAIDKVFTATADSSGQIVLQFATGAVDQPEVSGIVVAPASNISTTAWYSVISQNSNSCVDISGGSNFASVEQETCANQQTSQEWQFVPTSNGYYSVINRSAGTQNMVWDVQGGPTATAPGTPIDLYTNGQGTNQQWMPIALGNGYYKFGVLNSGLCLDIPNAQTANGVELDIATCNGTAEQSFRLMQQP